ncbi:MAG: hypothetical protein K0R65_1110 [Crocinitomicaceae bacterium]|jgi:hypothetical protein|nr:hypothetical protein [Crocinitomicaceae bacterium]
MALLVPIATSYSVLAAGCVTPATPTAVTATDINPWDAQVNYSSGGGTTTAIYTEVCTNNTFTAGCQTTLLSPTTSKTSRFENLACNTTYAYRVRAYNDAGAGCFSPAVTGTFTTPACPASVSNSCSGATTLTNGGATRCFTTSGATTETGEGVCGSLTSGICSWETVWFKFQATTTESTITLNRSNNSYFQTDLVAFGPYASSAAASSACMPSGGSIVTNSGSCVTDFDDYDPLYSISFATVANQWYLIQVINEDCGVYSDEDYQGCIQVDPTPSNNKPSGSSLIDECGTTFNGTNKGYSPSNIMPGNENLDGNAGTTCAGCTAGDNVPYVVNNDSWFNFCATSTGNWSVDFEGISNCINGSGLQMTIFRGTPTNLTTIWNAGSPSIEGSSQTSSAFTVNTGECIYMVVDGFAGDQCDYQYQLNNLTTPCNLLPVDLGDFFVVNIENKNKLVWTTYGESNSDYFLVERSVDGISWRSIGQVEAAHESTGYLTYSMLDANYVKGMNYYRLSQFDIDGQKQLEKITQVDNSAGNDEILEEYNLLGQKIDAGYRGIVIRIFKSGRMDKIVK